MAHSKTRKRSPKSPAKTKAPRAPRSYTPVADALRQPFIFADTELAEGIQRHGLSGLLGTLMGQRRADGEPLHQVLCALLIWPLLQVASIHCFCTELNQILKGKVSVLYDFLGREDVHWRAVASALSGRVQQQNELGPLSTRGFVFDDTLQERAGRKVEGTSAQYDHTQGRTVKGHQMLQLGLATEKGFLPIEAQLVMGEKAAVDKRKPFQDQRSAAARDFSRARDQTKPQLFRQMLRRALRAGFRAAYVLADAWFGSKENIACALELNLIGLFQMKRGNLAYEYQGQSYTASQLYTQVQRQMKPQNAQARFKTASLIVRLNLAITAQQPDQWVEVRLVFSAPVRATSADTWVVFLCTKVTLRDDQILQVYCLRWSIEVYFKEIKQHLGFLKEQSGRYQVAYASIHLAAVRYLLLFEAMLRSGHLSYGQVRDRASGQLQVLTYATLLWHLFRALIEGALDQLVQNLGQTVVDQVMAAIDQTVESFLQNALQLSPGQVTAQLKAEELGYL